MTRVKRGTTKHRRHSKTLKLAKGYYSARRRRYKAAKEAVLHANMYAYAHRRERKGDFRKLWILRIGAASRTLGLTYGQLVNGLSRAGIQINRKVLADLAVREPTTFSQLVEKAKQALPS
ncbi:MAG: 50S ribosomal protein L20 [Chloroflexi bacterium]|nr:50S ribosomal protein L20 [Chloroflexota bacterium]